MIVLFRAGPFACAASSWARKASLAPAGFLVNLRFMVGFGSSFSSTYANPTLPTFLGRLTGSGVGSAGFPKGLSLLILLSGLASGAAGSSFFSKEITFSSFFSIVGYLNADFGGSGVFLSMGFSSFFSIVGCLSADFGGSGVFLSKGLGFSLLLLGLSADLICGSSSFLPKGSEVIFGLGERRSYFFSGILRVSDLGSNETAGDGVDFCFTAGVIVSGAAKGLA